jgi:hypothetical protein
MILVHDSDVLIYEEYYCIMNLKFIYYSRIDIYEDLIEW